MNSESQATQDDFISRRQLNNNMLKIIFVLVCYTNILMNVDHGIIPATTSEMKVSLDIGDTQLGVMGSLVYCGVVIAGFFAAKVYMYFPSQIVLIGALVCLMGTLIAFSYVKILILLYLIRTLTGCFQVLKN